MIESYKSRVYVGSSSGSALTRLLLQSGAMILFVVVLVKFSSGQFGILEYISIFVAVVALILSARCGRVKPHYIDAEVKINFMLDRMIISYLGVDGGKKIGKFDEVLTIRYKEIENIVYGVGLECYRIIAKCEHKKTYFGFGEPREQVVSDREKVGNIFLYIYQDAGLEMKEKLQQYTGKKVIIMEEQMAR